MSRPDSKRALRRYHLQRKRKKAIEVFKSGWFLRKDGRETEEEWFDGLMWRVVRSANNMKRCSCYACGNPKSGELRTRQERFSIMKLKEEF